MPPSARPGPVAVVLALVLLAAAPPPAAATHPVDAPLAGDGPLPIEDLVAAARALDRGETGAAQGHVASARDVWDDRFAAHSADGVPTAAADTALDALAEETDPVRFRTRLVRFEAALLTVAAGNVEAALDAGDPATARAWLRAAHRLVDQPGRSLPFAGPLADLAAGQNASRTAVATALDAAAAFRLLGEVQAADDLRAVGEVDWPVHARRAGHWWNATRPRAAAVLPAGAFDALDANMTRLADVLEAMEEPAALPGVRGPLTAMAYHRSIERLDEVGAGVEAGLFGLHRAAHRDPAAVPARWQAFLADYARHRGFLLLQGEGEPATLDAAVLGVNASLANGAAAVDDAVRHAARLLRDAALLEYGIVLKVETGAVRTDLLHRYEVTLLRPPLEGLRSYRATVAWDPAVVEVQGVDHRRFSTDFDATLDASNAVVTFGGTQPGPTGFTGGAVVGHLRLTGVGEPGERTGLNVTDAAFTTVRAEAAEVFFVRNGSATVADIRTDDGSDDGDGNDGPGVPMPTPGGGWTLAALMAGAGAALVLRRRGGRRGGGRRARATLRLR